MILVRDGLTRDVPKHRVAEYLAAGWSRPVIKKQATKPAEPAPEAANQDLGNDIFQGD